MNPILISLVEDYPDLEESISDIIMSIDMLKESFASGGQLLLCGNGGSASDCEHIVGELMKSFVRHRSLPEKIYKRFEECFPEDAMYLTSKLQGGLSAISLNSQLSLLTAICNDISADMVFAQQVYGYGRQGDVLMGLSTSGNSTNVINAVKVARVRGLKTIGLTGGDGGKMLGLCDCTIIVPAESTTLIQERHLPIYHSICRILEELFFD